MSKSPVEFIASQAFTRVKANGTIVEWHQENEAAVTSQVAAIGMVQRTIDFWLPNLVLDLQKKRKLSLFDAKELARRSFVTNIQEMMNAPFARKWGLMLTDFTFHVEDDDL